MFDNVGRTRDDEAVARSAIALVLVLLIFAFGWAVFVVYTILWAVQEVTGIPIIEPDLVEVALEEEPELEAPPPPPPPPPPPAAAQAEEEESEDTTPEPDQMVEEVKELEQKIEDKQVSAERPAGQVGGVEGGVEGGVVGGVLGGVVGGVVGGQLGGVKTFHHSELKKKREISPVYPETAKTMNLGEQRCVATVFIDEEGAPYDVSVGACPAVFHEAVKTAIFGWRWYPPKDDAGRKIKAQTKIGITFKLTG